MFGRPHAIHTRILRIFYSTLKVWLKIFILKKVNKCLSTSGPCHHTMAWSSKDYSTKMIELGKRVFVSRVSLCNREKQFKKVLK
jgi:hypothetical protein